MAGGLGESLKRIAECKALCEEANPAPPTPEQNAQFRILVAREYARAEARRSGAKQASLPLDEAA